MSKQETMQAIEAAVGLDGIVVSDRGEYIRVWNCYAGVLASVVSRRLREFASAHGGTYRRVRTFGNGQISAADWEDQVRV